MLYKFIDFNLRMLRSARKVLVYCMKFSTFMNDAGVRKNFSAELHCSATWVFANACWLDDVANRLER